MGNKYTKSFSDAFKMYLGIFPRQAVYKVKIQTCFKCIWFAGCHLNVKNYQNKNILNVLT